jgi:hypothetical protein
MLMDEQRCQQDIMQEEQNQKNGKLAPYNKHLNPIEGNLLVANRTDIKTQ